MSQNTNHTNKSKHNSNRPPSHQAKPPGSGAAPSVPSVKSSGLASAETVPTIKSAIKEVEVGATHLVQAVNAEVQTRTGEAIDTIKEKLSLAEEKVEKLVEQIPGVGPDAAQKLRALTRDPSTASSASSASTASTASTAPSGPTEPTRL